MAGLISSPSTHIQTTFLYLFAKENSFFMEPHTLLILLKSTSDRVMLASESPGFTWFIFVP